MDNLTRLITSPKKFSTHPQLGGKRARYIAAFASVFLLASSASTYAAEYTWTGTGGTALDFNDIANYSPSGGSGGVSLSDLVFDTALGSDLFFSGGPSPLSVHIKSGASGFVLDDSGSSSDRLEIRQGGLTVDAGTVATLNTTLASVNSTSASPYSLDVTVGAGGSLTVNKGIRMITTLPSNGSTRSIPFNKNGAGTLILNGGRDQIRAGNSFHFNEGTVTITDGALFGTVVTGTSPMPIGEIPISLGTSSTTATLGGAGAIDGTVTTESAARAIIDPDGVFTIRNLDLTAGASIGFELGVDSIDSGVWTGNYEDGPQELIGATSSGTIVLNLTGGEAGELYTLFSGYDSLIGLESSDFLIESEGYTVDFWNIDAGTVQVQFSSIPEPSMGALLTSVGAMLVCCTRRRRAKSSVV